MVILLLFFYVFLIKKILNHYNIIFNFEFICILNKNLKY